MLLQRRRPATLPGCTLCDTMHTAGCSAIPCAGACADHSFVVDMIIDARVAASSAQGGGGAGIGTAPARGQQGSCCAQLQGDARVYLGPCCMCSTCAFVGRCSSAAAGTNGRPTQIRRWHQWRCGCLFLFFRAVMHWREGVRSTVQLVV